MLILNSDTLTEHSGSTTAPAGEYLSARRRFCCQCSTRDRREGADVCRASSSVPWTHIDSFNQQVLDAEVPGHILRNYSQLDSTTIGQLDVANLAAVPGRTMRVLIDHLEHRARVRQPAGHDCRRLTCFKVDQALVNVV